MGIDNFQTGVGDGGEPNIQHFLTLKDCGSLLGNISHGASVS